MDDAILITELNDFIFCLFLYIFISKSCKTIRYGYAKNTETDLIMVT